MKIAIVKLSALGDIVHAMVALQFLKQVEPGMEIDWVVEQRFADVLAHNPMINELLTVNLKALKNNPTLIVQELGKLWRYSQQQYDLVIDAQGLIKSALVARVLSERCAGFDQDSIRERWAAYLYSQTLAYPYDANTIDRNVSVITQPFGIEVSKQQIIDKQRFLFYTEPQQNLDEYFKADQPNVVLVIGSTWRSRNYPLDNFLQVIYKLQANCLICWGSEQEHWMAQSLADNSLARVLPPLSLNDLKAVIARADLVIGNDTGPTHMAWGLNRPSITLFGPTPISRVYQTPINKVLKSPSIVDPFKLDKDDFSIAEIPVDAVVKMARELLANGATATGMLESAPQ